MNSNYQQLSPILAWQRFPESQWGEAEARHLLNRCAFAAPPDAVKQALSEGMVKTVQVLLGKSRSMPKPEPFEPLHEEAMENFQSYRSADEETKRTMQQEHRRNERQALARYMVKWYQYAREPHNQAFEKWVLFLQDIFVVGLPKIRNPIELYQYQESLREHAYGSYGDLCKAVSRQAAMVKYLDLDKNTKGKPNENFARELFELFMLGEGNYTEADIKEAARAFTGYRCTRLGKFYINKSQHDPTMKTVFGQSGRYDGDAIIDLALQQPAASAFLPRELVSYYLSADTELAPEYYEQLGKHWRVSGFKLNELAVRFFTSNLFYHPQFRANYIKSPTQLYLGMLTDLHLDVAPFPGQINNAMRGMGQQFFTPPNVRGWQYGKHWINSTTLAARRNLVQRLLYPVDESKLNADEYVELMSDRADGRGEISISNERLGQMADKSPEQIIDTLINYFYAGAVPEHYRSVLVEYMRQPQPAIHERIRRVTITMLQSPEYQLC